MPTVNRRWRVKGEDEVRAAGGCGGRGVESREGGWNPNLITVGGEKKTTGGNECWMSVQKMLALWLLNPAAPPVTPTPLSSTPTHSAPLARTNCPPRDRWRQIDGRRAPPLGQTMVVWHDAAQLKSTQLRMADMDCCTQDTPRPKRRQMERRNSLCWWYSRVLYTFLTETWRYGIWKTPLNTDPLLLERDPYQKEKIQDISASAASMQLYVSVILNLWSCYNDQQKMFSP